MFWRRLPVALLADDVGLGKTNSAGLVISELAARGRLSGILIVCPKLQGPQWKAELETKFGIPAVVPNGRELLEAEPAELGAVITTYNSARLHPDQLPSDRFQMLILDEAHKLRNLHGVPNPPQVAVKFPNALADRRFRFDLMLTATPIQNRVKLQNYYAPGELERAIGRFVHYENERRYHEAIGNVTPSDMHEGRQCEIWQRREKLKRRTMKQRRLENLKPAA